jgi:hypothetical protein
LNTMPESGDLAGPSGRPAIRNGSTSQAQIRYSFLIPDEVSGLYGDVSVEMPGPDVNLPAGLGYSTFSRYPDFVTTFRYQAADVVQDPCDGGQYIDERWHLQFGTLVRDLGVEGDGISVNPVRTTATGWGTQLSGRMKIFPLLNPCGNLSDYMMFTVTYGNGIGHYFADLHNVDAVNDAAYNAITDDLTPLPLFAYYAGYQHDWLPHLRSTAVYSHIDLDSQVVPGSMTPYHRGDYFSINLVAHSEPCTPIDAERNARLSFFGGMEYLFGQRENLAGDWGANQRVMLFFGASK